MLADTCGQFTKVFITLKYPKNRHFNKNAFLYYCYVVALPTIVFANLIPVSYGILNPMVN